jgi:hypothetical protein
MPSPSLRPVVVLAALALAPVVAPAAENWDGWRRFEVVRVDDGASEVQVAAIGGRATAVIVNRRQSRIDLLRIGTSSTGAVAPAADPAAVNRIPMPPDMVHERIPCPAPPLGAAVVGGDVVVVCGTPWRVLRFRRGATDWQMTASRDLPDIEPERRLRLLALPGAGQSRLLIPTASGIQTVTVPAAGGIDAPDWLRPRTRSRGVSWDLADLDRDGDLDLVEAFPTAGGSIRWQEQRDGVLAPPQPIFDDPVKAVAGIQGPFPLALVGRGQQDGVDLARLDSAADAPLGAGWTIPLPAQAVAVGASVAGHAVLAVANPGEGRIELHRLGESWSDGGSFPAPKGIKAMLSLRAGEILMWVGEQADLLRTRWEDGRLTYPEPWRPDGAIDSSSRTIVGMDGTGTVGWWFQRHGEDLLLWTWPMGATEPSSTRFIKAGDKISQAQWLAGDGAVVRTGFQADAELLIAKPDKPAVRLTAAMRPNLARLEPSKIRLVRYNGSVWPARIVDGTWQWLDRDLTVTDAVQLPDDEVADLVEIDGTVWVLAGKGHGAWRMERGSGGMLRPVERLRALSGERLRADPWLGVIASGPDSARIPAPGRTRTLAVAAQADLRALTPVGAVQASRIAVAPVRGAGQDLLVHDDPARRLALFAADGTPVGAWPVWEDRRYPYDGMDEDRKTAVAEPRAVAGGDLDGDGRPDLVLLAHDRALFYLTAPEARP